MTLAAGARALPPWVGRALRHPMASAAAMTLGIRAGQELYKLRNGELSREDFIKRFGQHTGALAGTLSGAAAGYAIGKALPGGVGAILGGFGGGLIGHVSGEHLGRSGAARLATVLIPEEEGGEVSPVAAAEPAAAEGPHEVEEEPPVVGDDHGH